MKIPAKTTPSAPARVSETTRLGAPGGRPGPSRSVQASTGPLPHSAMAPPYVASILRPLGGCGGSDRRRSGLSVQGSAGRRDQEDGERPPAASAGVAAGPRDEL